MANRGAIILIALQRLGEILLQKLAPPSLWLERNKDYCGLKLRLAFFLPKNIKPGKHPARIIVKKIFRATS